MKLLFILLLCVPVSLFAQRPDTVKDNKLYNLAAKDFKLKKYYDSVDFYRNIYRKSHSQLDTWPIRFWATKASMRLDFVLDSLNKRQ